MAWKAPGRALQFQHHHHNQWSISHPLNGTVFAHFHDFSRSSVLSPSCIQLMHFIANDCLYREASHRPKHRKCVPLIRFVHCTSEWEACFITHNLQYTTYILEQRTSVCNGPNHLSSTETHCGCIHGEYFFDWQILYQIWCFRSKFAHLAHQVFDDVTTSVSNFINQQRCRQHIYMKSLPFYILHTLWLI